MRPLLPLVRLLGVDFKDLGLLKIAVTHRSAGGMHNERLEFLGDSVLGFVVTDLIYRRFADASEGDLTRLRSTLVRGVTLARIGRKLELGDYLIMGSGELKSGGYRRDSVLEDAVEAIIGATYQDQGLEVARALVLKLLDADISRLRPDAIVKDPKTRLQEYQQAQRLALPVYTLVSETGPEHRRRYEVSCHIEGLDGDFAGAGDSRRAAEQTAAAVALQQLETL